MDNSSDVLYLIKASGFFQGFLPLFYLVPPSHTYFRNVEEVPKYVNEVCSISMVSGYCYYNCIFRLSHIF